MRVIGYLRVSTREQADSGAGLAAQRAAIQAEASRRNWHVTWVEDAGHSGKTMKRPGVQRALVQLRKGEADALVVAKLDRLSRSVQDFSTTLDAARRQRWALVALDLGVDTTTAAGELVATVMASVAQWERRAIGERTRDALAERKAAGVQLGRRRTCPDAVVASIVAARRTGLSYARIARDLDEAATPTPAGGVRWYPATVQRVHAAATRAED